MLDACVSRTAFGLHNLTKTKTANGNIPEHEWLWRCTITSLALLLLTPFLLERARSDVYGLSQETVTISVATRNYSIQKFLNFALFNICMQI